MEEKIRLNKYLSSAGVCSRREADRLIASGQVTVNENRRIWGCGLRLPMRFKSGERRSGFRRKSIAADE